MHYDARLIAQKISPSKTPLKAPLTKGVFKEVFLESLFSLQNQEWDPSKGKDPFSHYAKAVFKEVFKGAFKGVFKGDIFCTVIGTQLAPSGWVVSSFAGRHFRDQSRKM